MQRYQGKDVDLCGLDVHFYSFQQNKATAQLWIDRCTLITSFSINLNIKVSDLHQVVLQNNGADHLKSLGRPKQSGHITDATQNTVTHTLGPKKKILHKVELVYLANCSNKCKQCSLFVSQSGCTPFPPPLSGVLSEPPGGLPFLGGWGQAEVKGSSSSSCMDVL